MAKWQTDDNFLIKVIKSLRSTLWCFIYWIIPRKSIWLCKVVIKLEYQIEYNFNFNQINQSIFKHLFVESF